MTPVDVSIYKALESFKGKEVTEGTTFQTYSFIDALMALQPYLKDGFVIDVVTNQGYPQVIGTLHTFTLLTVAVAEGNDVGDVDSGVNTQDNPSDEAQVPVEKAEKKTRRAKANEG
jgi:hypothetical protein